MPEAVRDAAAAVNGRTLRALLRLAWPIVLARATQSVIGFCDALFVAPLGEVPLAATTTGALNALSAILLPMGTAFIVQSFVAQLRGRGELRATPRYAYYGLGIATIAGVLTAASIPAIPRLLRSLGYEGEVLHAMTEYMAIRFLSVGPAVGMEALGNWFGGLGKTRPAMVAGVVAMVVNVAGCALLVEPRLGLPGYGVAGAAWASVVGTLAGFGVLALMFLLGRDEAGSRRPRDLRAPEFWRILRFGLPNGVNWFLEFAAFALFINVVVAHLGTTVLAAFNVVMQLNAVAFMPAFGLATSGAILVGEAIGRGARDEVPPLVLLTAKANAAWMLSVGLLYAMFPEALLRLFQSRDAPASALVDVGATMLVFAALWQLFDAATLTLSEALRAAGDTMWPMVARLILAWIVFTPLAWSAVFVFHGGVKTIMTSLIAYLAVLAALFVHRFASGRWREIELVDSEPRLD